MADVEDMAVFVRVVELANLSAAGRDLRLSAAVVSNRIARLEQRLGVRLLNRTTRRVAVTPEGEIYYGHCVRILTEIEQAESEVSARRDLPRGPLTVTAPTAFGRQHVAPHIPRFVESYPEIQVRLHLSDRFTDLIEDRVDLAIRIAELKDSTAIVRTLAPNRRVICAAPAYLDSVGRPEVPEDLLKHNCLLLRFPGSQQFHWTLQGPDGPVTLPVAGSMDSDSSEVLRGWCLAGHGLALQSLFEVADDLAAGRLETVLPHWPPPGHAIAALYPHSRYLPPRVRVFIDFLVETYGKTPYWERPAAKAAAGMKRRKRKRAPD